MTTAEVPLDADGRRREAWAAGRLVHRVLDRSQETAFWAIQIGITLITMLHVAVEVNSPTHDVASAWSAVAHLPIMLYLVPVVYAGMRYGFEGSLLTSASVALIAAPNLLLWHRSSYEWLGEALSIAFVAAAGVAIAVPVEREQRQRAKAEHARAEAVTVSRRLGLLNDVISTLVRSADIDSAIDLVLRRLVEVLELDGAGIVTWQGDGSDRTVEIRHVVDGRGDGAFEAALATAGDATGDPHLTSLPFHAGEGRQGAVALRTRRGRPLRAEERELAQGIATQVGVAIDNARMHDAERQALEQYLRGITRVQEEERRRIARELHDVATHELLLLRRDLDDLPTAEPGAMPGRSDAVAMRRRIDNVTSCLRRFGRELRPSVLDHLGLDAALGWLASQADARGDVSVRTVSTGSPRRLDAEVELALYRIAEEGLRNAERHAGASSIAISVAFAGDHVSVCVQDDGRGFEVPGRPGGLVAGDGLGLIGMQERAALVGAELVITSTRGRGTRLVVTVHDRDRAEGPGPTLPEGPGAGHHHGQPLRAEGEA